MRISLKLGALTMRAAFSHIPFMQSAMWMFQTVVVESRSTGPAGKGADPNPDNKRAAHCHGDHWLKEMFKYGIQADTDLQIQPESATKLMSSNVNMIGFTRSTLL